MDQKCEKRVSFEISADNLVNFDNLEAALPFLEEEHLKSSHTESRSSVQDVLFLFTTEDIEEVKQT